MFRSGVQKITGSLFFTYIIGFAILFLWSLIFPAYRVLSGFFVSTAFLQGALLFLNYLIPLHCTGLLLTYSLMLGSEAGKVEKNIKDFRAIVSPAAVLLIFLTLCYTAVVIWWKPSVESGIDANVAKTVIARNFFDKARNAYNDKDYKNAADFVRYSLSIEPQWNEALALERIVRKNLIVETEKSSGTQKTLGIRYEEQSEGQTTDQIMQKARTYYESGNYYSAYYFATLAQKLDSGRSDAKTLAVDSINKITASELNSTEKDVRDFYRKKHDGYTAILNRDYITAYYIFNELAKTYPGDKEVAEYLEKSKQYINVLSFFKDEVQNIEAFPGTDNILFINRETPTFKEFVLIGRMIQVREGTYFKDVEVMSISGTGEILSHMKAPYGKYIYASVLKELANSPFGVSNNFINFNCIDRNDPNFRLLPVYLQRSNENQVLANYLNIIPEVSDLRNYRISDSVARTASWTELLNLKTGSAFEKRGYSTFGIDNELLTRTAYPFAFLVFSLLCIAIGWVFRSKYMGRPPIISFFFIPVFPIILALFVDLYIFMSTAISGLVLMLFGFILALVITFIVQGILVVVSFVILAGKITE